MSGKDEAESDAAFQKILPTFKFNDQETIFSDALPENPSSVDVLETKLDDQGHQLIAITYLDKNQLQIHDFVVKPGEYVPDSSLLVKEDYSGTQFLKIFGKNNDNWELIDSETINYRKNEQYSLLSGFKIS